MSLPLPHEGDRCELNGGVAIISFPDVWILELPKDQYYGDSRFYHLQTYTIAAGDLVWMYFKRDETAEKLLKDLGFKPDHCK